jgi:hypothetical protein
MADDYIHNNPWDAMEEIFFRLEERVVNISCNISLLMVALENRFVPFRKVGVSNSEDGFDEKPGDSEDPKRSQEKNLRKSNQVPVPSILHNLYLKWKPKWISNPTKVIFMLLILIIGCNS